MYIFAVYDLASEHFSAPLLFANEAVARRWFENWCHEQKDKALVRDSRMFCIGTYDDEVPAIASFDNPKHIVDGTAFLEE